MINPIKAGANILQAKRKYDEFQKKMREVTVAGESKKGLVKVTINGLKEVVDVRIDDILMDDKVELQKHIKDATNDAGKRFEKDQAKLMDKDSMMDMLKGIMG
jgi:DNA-binding YbaB/EbfC family protein